MVIELLFPVMGERLPLDHAYPLYGALSKILPALHESGCRWAIAPIAGQFAGRGELAVVANQSRLRLRLPDGEIGLALPLAGKALEIAGYRLRLGVPQVRALTPPAALAARLVTIKGFTEPAPFLDAVRRKLGDSGIGGEPTIPLAETGPRAGQPRRRVLRIKDRRVVGFTLYLTALSAADSIAIQENTAPNGKPIFSRTRLGCAFFQPLRGLA